MKTLIRLKIEKFSENNEEYFVDYRVFLIIKLIPNFEKIAFQN